MNQPKLEPIPDMLLGEEIELLSPLTFDVIKLLNVRVEVDVESLVKSDNPVREVITGITVWIDAANSTKIDKIEDGGILVYKEMKFFIDGVKSYKNPDGSLHHYKISACRDEQEVQNEIQM